MKRIFALIVVVLFAASPSVYPHCEIPCGIYDDQQRIEMIKEDILTVEKSMNMITELSKGKDINYNQLVRWVDNKEIHAGKIQDVVFQYFMTQRIKSVDPRDRSAQEKYTRELQLLHKLAVAAMKAKQTTDLTYIKEMRDLVNTFASSYFEKSK